MKLNALAKRIQRGDHAAYQEIVTRYGKMVYYTAVAELDDSDKALDASKRVFRALFTDLRKGNVPEDAAKYLQRSVRYQCKCLDSEEHIMSDLLVDIQADNDVDMIFKGLDDYAASAASSGAVSVAMVPPLQVDDKPAAVSAVSDDSADGGSAAATAAAAAAVAAAFVVPSAVTAPAVDAAVSSTAEPTKPEMDTADPTVVEPVAAASSETAEAAAHVASAEVVAPAVVAAADVPTVSAATTPLPSEVPEVVPASDASAFAFEPPQKASLLDTDPVAVAAGGAATGAAAAIIAAKVPEVASAADATTQMPAAVRVEDLGNNAAPVADKEDDQQLTDNFADKDSEIYRQFYGQAEAIDKKKGHVGFVFGIIFTVILVLILAWLVVGVLGRLGVITSLPDLGYSWFNQNIIPLF